MGNLTRTEIIDILLNEMECVQRASDGECDRDCAQCDLLRNTDQILQAYRIAIKALEHPEENVITIMPSAEKTGHWTRISMDKYVQHAMAYYRCSECGKDIIGEHNYCPNCGCAMKDVNGNYKPSNCRWVTRKKQQNNKRI